jgi:hypothetical protein
MFYSEGSVNARKTSLNSKPMIFFKEYNGLHNFPTLFIPLNLKVPYGQIGSASEWYHWKGLEKDHPL